MSTYYNDVPAFPIHGALADYQYPGMTLRDYFAARCDQPGMTEVVTHAGLILSGGMVWSPDDPMTPIARSFDEWWIDKVSQADRFRLYAEVRYAMADAMLKAREGS